MITPDIQSHKGIYSISRIFRSKPRETQRMRTCKNAFFEILKFAAKGLRVSEYERSLPDQQFYDFKKENCNKRKVVVVV